MQGDVRSMKTTGNKPTTLIDWVQGIRVLDYKPVGKGNYIKVELVMSMKQWEMLSNEFG